MKHMPNPKTRDSGTSRLTWMVRIARYEGMRSVRALRSTVWVHYGKPSDPAMSPLAAEGTINTPDTDTRDP